MKLIRTLLPLALAGGLFAAAAAPAVAAAPATAPTRTAASAKPTVSAPPAGVAVGSVNVPKPGGAHKNAVRPLTSWAVTLTASSYNLWPTQYTTLTATANNDVGPTPYYIYIANRNTGVTVGRCGTGTVCSVSVTSNTSAVQDFVAYVSDLTDVNENHAVAVSTVAEITWFFMSISMEATAHTLPIGNLITLTETSLSDIGPSPFYVQIWDTTTAALLVQCGFGTTCSANVSQSVATTHAFVATFAPSSTAYPPATTEATSATNYITWTNSGMSISLTAPSITINVPGTVTATANINVGPTPYYIEIFDEFGNRIAVCGTGTTCSTNYYAGRDITSNLVAFISNSDSTLPPGSIQASSNIAVMESAFVG